MISLLILIFFLFLTALISCMETAFFSLSPFSVDVYKFTKDKRKRIVYNLLLHPRDLLVTLLILNIVANILVQNTFSNIFKQDANWFFKVGVPLLLVLFLGEIFPKTIAILNNEKIAYKTSYILSFFYNLCRPIAIIFTKIAGFVSRFLFFFLKKEKSISKEELIHIIETSEKTKVLNEEERNLALKYLEIKNSFVKEIMCLKEEILAFDIKNNIETLKEIFKKKENVALIDGSIDKIIGTLYLKDFILHEERIKDANDLKKFSIKPFFVFENANSLDVFLKMKKEKKKEAFVIDEYGLIVGIVSKQDFLKKFLGELQEEKEKESLYIKYGKDVLIADAKMEILELKDVFNLDIKSETSQITIGGWMVEKFEKIPQAGENFTDNNVLFYVLEAYPNKIKKIYIRKLHG